MNFSEHKMKLFAAVPVALLIGLLYYVRPWIHPVAMGFYVNPWVLQAAVLGLLTGLIVYWRSGEGDGGGFAISLGVVTALVFVLVGGVADNAFTNVAMAEDVQRELTEIDSLPEMDTENPRILPRNVADEFAGNSLQEPRHRLASSDIAISDDGTPQWSYPLRPDGLANIFLIDQRGAAYADMTTSSSDINYNSEEMDVGIGVQVRDNINWVQRKERFFVNYEDHFVLEHDDSNYIATPYTEYDFRFTFPIVHTVPEWGGTVLTDSGGNIDYIEAGEVVEHEILQNQRNYPFDLARKYVSSMEYREGIINKWFFHENQLEVAPVPGFDNDQPFMMLTEDNPELFIATEPFGDASGLFEVWTIDGVTGEYELYRLERDEGLIGANRAVNFVRQANSRVNWADQDSDTGFAPIEPLPIIVDDKLYWQVRVVPLDSAGVAFTSFVDADTSNIFTAQDDEEIIEFLEGEELDEAVREVENPEASETGVEITIIEGGEVNEVIRTDSMDFDIEIRE